MTANFVKLRKNLKLSVNEIAELLGISTPHYLLIEENQIPPSRILIQKLSKLFPSFPFINPSLKHEHTKTTALNIKDETLDKHFLRCILNFKQYLEKLKLECDELNKSIKIIADQKQWIQENKKNIFKNLDKYFHDVWDLYQKLPENQLNKHKIIYQNLLQPLIFLCSLNEYIYEKPLGYPGDYIMMDYLYNDEYIGDSLFSKLIHKYTCSIPVARANTNRRGYFKDKIKQIMQLKKESHRVMSVACGPAVEIQDYLQYEYLPPNYQFICFDFEPLALSFIEKNLESLQTRMNKKFNVTFIRGDIRHLIRKSNKEMELGNQDLIYASGLTDYLSNRLATRIINSLYNLLAPGGTLIIVNVLSNDHARAYYELIGEWHLNRRTHGNMLELAKDLKNAAEKIYIEDEKETKMNLFLNIKKQAKC